MDTELATITKSPMATQSTPGRQKPVRQRLWRRTTGLEEALIGICGMALMACVVLVTVVATSSSSFSAVAEELMQQPQPLVFAQQRKDDPLQTVQVTTRPIKASRLPVLKGFSHEGKPVEVCDTPQCAQAADELILAMDTSVDPCDNFYKFACGRWIKHNPVPIDSFQWGHFDEMHLKVSNALSTILSEPITEDDPHPIAKAKTFYQGCMNERRLEEMGLTPLTDFLDQFGGWAMTINDWDVTSFDWQTAMAEGKRQIGADYLVKMLVAADEKDTSSTVIYIDQTSLGLPRPMFLDPENFGLIIFLYKYLITGNANLIANSLGQNLSLAQIDEDAIDLLVFEKTLAEITSPDEARRDADRMYNPMTVEELSNYSNLDWLPILSTMFASTNITLDKETRIIVKEPEYISNMTQLMLSSNQRTLSNYMMWRHVFSLIDDTTQAMRDAFFQYSMMVKGVTANKQRSNQCAEKTNDFLGMAIGREYVKTYFSQEAKDEANEMVEHLRSAIITLLEANKWMDAETKPKAIEKANAIAKFIGYPDWYENETALEVFYKDLGDLDNRTHFANVLTIRGWAVREELGEFGHPSKRDRWFMPPTTVNAYYMPEYNSITLLAGILQSPFYRPNTIMALNYGGIGQVIGHEITHGFDDQGRQYNKDGNMLPWWNNETLQAFQSHAQCIVDQYDSIRLPQLDESLPNATINGINTQGENIADNGGLRGAFLAYKMYVDRYGEEPRLPGLTEYSPMQLFFLNNAYNWCQSSDIFLQVLSVLIDPHSPAEFRILMPMANMEEFSELWGCPVGSGMNPKHKCVIW